jgi:phosphomannomutase
MRDLDAIIKAYDVRGIYPDQVNEDLARDVGAAFAVVVGAYQSEARAIVVGHDMRPSGPDLVAAFSDGVTGQGVDVVNIGLCSTDGLYYASGSLGLPGAMFTASHNPAQYNGIKLCRAGAAPVGQDTGLAEIKAMVARGVPDAPVPVGTVSFRDLLADYAVFLRSLVDLDGIRPLKIVVDAGNGMAGLTAPAVLGPLGLDVTELYYELDGTFPNHEANPIEAANLVDLQERCGGRSGSRLAFDGDADRCFAVDEHGRLVSPST